MTLVLHLIKEPEASDKTRSLIRFQSSALELIGLMELPVVASVLLSVEPDGLVEAVYHSERSFVWGVQWHPELSFKVDEDSRKIFVAFLEASRGEGKRENLSITA